VILSRGTAGSRQTSLAFFGATNANGITRIDSESTGAVQINLDANSGTGGLAVASGGASPAIVATIDSAGQGNVHWLSRYTGTYADITETAAPGRIHRLE
jgi:hypothetical protein